MNNSVFKSMIAFLVLSVALIASLVLFDRSVFSLTGFVSESAGICAYQSIGVAGSGRKRLERHYDLDAIALEMRSKPNYSIVRNGKELKISRAFVGVTYNLIFVESNGATELSADNYDPDYTAGKYYFGEGCTAPQSRIESNLMQIFTDMALNEEQVNELRASIRITTSRNIKLGT